MPRNITGIPNTGGSSFSTPLSVANIVTIDTSSTEAFSVRKTANYDTLFNCDTKTGTVSIIGDLNVTGNASFTNTTSFAVSDNLISMGTGNPADALDLGFFGTYVSAGTKYCGLFRQNTSTGDGTFKLFTSGTVQPNNTVSNYTLADLYVGSLYGTIATGTQNSITALGGLTSIQGQAINANVWPYVSTLNQNLTTTSTPIFGGISTTGDISSNLEMKGKFIKGTTQILAPTGSAFFPGISFYNYLGSGFYSDASTIYVNNTSGTNTWQFGTSTNTSLVNLSLNSNSITNVNTITATTLAGTLSMTSQPNITSIGSLTQIGAITGYTSTIWQYVRDMQNVSTNSTPIFRTIQLQSAVSGTALAMSAGISSWNCFLTIGRTSADMTLGIAGDVNQVFTGSIAGDTALRNENAAGKIMLGNTSQCAMIINGSGNLTLGSSDLAGSTTGLYVNGAGAYDTTIARFMVGSNNPGKITFGRTTNEGALCVVNSNNEYLTTAVSGDICLMNLTAGKKVLLGTASGVGISISGGNVSLPSLGSANASSLQVNTGTGLLTLPVSSARYKENITDSKVDTSIIYNTVAKEFDYKADYGGYHDVGYIAEDLHELGLSNIVNYDSDNRPDSIKWDKLSFFILEEMKKLKAKCDAYEIRLAALEAT